MKKFGKMLTAAALAASCLAISIPGYAAYSLSEEVKAPTPALKQASEIGVRSYSNPALQNLPDKDAMVVMSFGTTMKETRGYVFRHHHERNPRQNHQPDHRCH